MKKYYIAILILSLSTTLFSQEKFLTKKGYITFFSHTVIEDIKAENNQVLSIINTDTGEIAVQLLMRAFQFKKALMQEHFNENYVESHKFPKAKFNGHIANFNELNNLKTKAEINGVLNIRGKEKKVTLIANVEVKKDQINILGDFTVNLADFDIEIPAVVKNNISKSIKITLDLKHKPYK